MIQANDVLIAGVLQECAGIRYTPSGQPVIDLTLIHESNCEESGISRRVSLTLSAIAFGSLALSIVSLPLGSLLELRGFIASRSLRSQRLVLHVKQYRLMEES